MITRPRETISRGPFLLSVRYAHVLGTTGTFQNLCHVRALPGRVRMGEVTVIAELLEHGLIQSQRSDHAVWRQVEYRADSLFQHIIGIDAGTQPAKRSKK